MTAPAVTFSGDEMSATFGARGTLAGEGYEAFKKWKGLPESPRVDYDAHASTYTLTAPARFASHLGVQAPPPPWPDLPIADHLFDDQRAILDMALAAKRFACWCDCGWGKTPLGLEYARHAIHRTGKGVLIVTLNEIVGQWIDEAAKFYGDALPVHRVESRAEMRTWLASGIPEIGITNYEKWNPENLNSQVVTEARHLGGVILDESSRLKTGGGKQKWALIKSCKGIEYKLSLTATPAPNDVMEFASQASFLEKMRSEGEILWTYFTRDEKTHRWSVKPHARAAFFEFMAGWSIYVRDPRRYGWRLGMAEVPRPELVVSEVKATPEQMEERAALTTDSVGQMSFLDDDTNAIQRARLSQVAKGFLYTDRKPAEPEAIGPGVHRGQPGWKYWDKAKDGDPIGFDLYRRHYSAKKNPNPKIRQFVGPGGKEVLIAKDGKALFAWRDFIDDSGQTGVNCAVFRNESDAQSSDMIREAMEVAWERWPGRRLYTSVDPGSVKSSNPGYCFIKAGWRKTGDVTRKGLVILEALPPGVLVADPDRAKAKGARYARPIPSLKPAAVAEIVRADVAAGLQVLVWTEFDAESTILEKLLTGLECRACNACNRPMPKVGHCTGCGCPETRPCLADDVAFGGKSPAVALLTGKTDKKLRPGIVADFKAGKHLVLITRAKVLGWGMNLQNVGSMVFSGWSDSYESYYQAVRRAYRHGQTRSVRVHLPVIPELEGDMLENLWRKQADHEAAIAEMENQYVKVRRAIGGVA